MNNIALTIDESDCKLKIMYYKANKSIAYKEYSFNRDCLKPSINYEKIFKTLDLFAEEENIHSGAAVYVLPDRFVACDFIEIPSFSSKKPNETLNLQMSTRYPNFGKMEVSYVEAGEYEVNTAFFAYMINASLIAKITAALKQSKFSLKFITFESAMTANSFLSLRTIRRRDTVLLADVKEGRTRLTIIKDSKLTGFGILPYGTELLASDKKIVSPIPILTTEEYFQNKLKSTLDLCQKEDGDTKANVTWLLDALTEMCDTAAARYHMENIILRYNVQKQFAPLFAPYCNKNYKNLEPITIKSPLVAEHLELYGALNPKQFMKGLLF